MFNLRDFIKKGLLDAVGKMADYQVILNASGWLEKGVLTEDDLAEIDAAIIAHNTRPVFEDEYTDEDVDVNENITEETEATEQ